MEVVVSLSRSPHSSSLGFLESYQTEALLGVMEILAVTGGLSELLAVGLLKALVFRCRKGREVLPTHLVLVAHILLASDLDGGDLLDPFWAVVLAMPLKDVVSHPNAAAALLEVATAFGLPLSTDGRISASMSEVLADSCNTIGAAAAEAAVGSAPCGLDAAHRLLLAQDFMSLYRDLNWVSGDASAYVACLRNRLKEYHFPVRSRKKLNGDADSSSSLQSSRGGRKASPSELPATRSLSDEIRGLVQGHRSLGSGTARLGPQAARQVHVLITSVTCITDLNNLVHELGPLFDNDALLKRLCFRRLLRLLTSGEVLAEASCEPHVAIVGEEVGKIPRPTLQVEVRVVLSRSLHALSPVEVLRWCVFMHWSLASKDPVKQEVTARLASYIAAYFSLSEILKRSSELRAASASLPSLLLLDVVEHLTGDESLALLTQEDRQYLSMWARTMRHEVDGCVRRASVVDGVIQRIEGGKRKACLPLDDRNSIIGPVAPADTTEAQLPFVLPLQQTRDALQAIFGPLTTEYVGSSWDRFTLNGARLALQQLHVTHRLSLSVALEQMILLTSTNRSGGGVWGSGLVSPRQLLLAQAENNPCEPRRGEAVGDAKCRRQLVASSRCTVQEGAAMPSLQPSVHSRLGYGPLAEDKEEQEGGQALVSRRLALWVCSAAHLLRRNEDTRDGDDEAFSLLCVGADELTDSLEKRFAAVALRCVVEKLERGKGDSSGQQETSRELRLTAALGDHIVDTELKELVHRPSAAAATALLESACCTLRSWQAAGRAQNDKTAAGGWFNETAVAIVIAYVRNMCYRDLIILAKSEGARGDTALQWYSSLLLEAQDLIPSVVDVSPCSPLKIPPGVHRRAVQRIFGDRGASSWDRSLAALTELHQQAAGCRGRKPGVVDGRSGAHALHSSSGGLPHEALSEVFVQLVSRRLPVPHGLRSLSAENW